ncbi:Uncharacterized protein, UPF0297 family [Desulfonispora thiosulfatigenes DSM 11270]|uniref:UPF0297 protein SAMN00017405_0444 n=1 Tax=Desulfonispora thiosulfatigenes DSM 11270 TaxID=656914 RepID=A0A1W1VQW0_DESTI|nr:IreB family regulatory phosphoprotein [Desulfonispora thiosulfatigenes]SMB95610.1 Uncharacterized protein, UPF0297 family [Desulfonispora thiosulfatigenes DSM 11270]
MASDLDKTMYFNVKADEDISPKKILDLVYEALIEKGYDPVNQIVGYLLSGDPSYITSHNEARSTIRKMERDEIIEELVKDYLKK